MEEIMTLITSYGFPMVITVYLLVRMEPLIRGLQKSIDTLTLVVSLQRNIQGTDLEQFQDIVRNIVKENSS
jgi:hypothetical protein